MLLALILRRAGATVLHFGLAYSQCSTVASRAGTWKTGLRSGLFGLILSSANSGVIFIGIYLDHAFSGALLMMSVNDLE